MPTTDNQQLTTNNQESKVKSARGFALLASVVIMAAFLALTLALATIFLAELVSTTEIVQSTKAVYIADAGIEKTLIFRNNPGDIPAGCNCPNFCDLAETGGSFCRQIKPNTDPTCDAENYCIKAIGNLGRTRRSIEVRY